VSECRRTVKSIFKRKSVVTLQRLRDPAGRRRAIRHTCDSVVDIDLEAEAERVPCVDLRSADRWKLLVGIGSPSWWQGWSWLDICPNAFAWSHKCIPRLSEIKQGRNHVIRENHCVDCPVRGRMRNLCRMRNCAAHAGRARELAAEC
jgi:hypothetical protein